MKHLGWAAAAGALVVAVACGSSRDTSQVGPSGPDAGAGGAAQAGDGGAGGEGQDAVDLVDRCEAVVGDTCAVLAQCCHPGTQFDAFECRRTQLDACFQLLGLEATGSDLSVYDRSAAEACLRPLTECPQDNVAPDPYGYDPYGGSSTSFLIDENDPAQVQACNRVQSGQRPLGSACNQSAQCVASEGEGYSECYYSPQRGQGVCAQAIYSADASCSFDPATLLHTICPPDAYCQQDGQTGGPDPYGPYPPYGGPTPPQGADSFAFTGVCRSYRMEGQRCVDAMTGESFPCAQGLVCDYGLERCARPLAEGEPCAGSSVGCERGLMCDYGVDRCVVNANPAVDGSSGGPFCYVDPGSQPQPTCGDGLCEQPREDPYICPVDCSICGDYQCTGDEPSWCPEDCGYIMPPYPPEYFCGDGLCDPGEESYCDVDCGIMACLPFDTCMAAQPNQPTCVGEAGCVCDFCSCQHLECSRTTGCLAIAACVEASGCLDPFDCYAPCRVEIDAADGPGGLASVIASDLMMCRLSSGCPSCEAPPTAVDAGAQPPPDGG